MTYLLTLKFTNKLWTVISFLYSISILLYYKFMLILTMIVDKNRCLPQSLIFIILVH